jgi:hypothetical protein
MPKLPRRIDVITDTHGQPKALRIDGEEFPYFLLRHAEIIVEDDALPTITITLAAQEIFMLDDKTEMPALADTQSMPIIDVEPGHGE